MFDTTSSNAGVHKGECVILQQLLGRQILWLPCRHHVLELIFRGAYHEVFGKKKSPTVAFFKILKDPATWNSLDLSNIRCPQLPTSLLSSVPSFLAFIDHRLLPENANFLPHCDYKEFLELLKLSLGAVLSGRKDGRSRSPDLAQTVIPGRWLRETASSNFPCSATSSTNPNFTGRRRKRSIS